MRRRISSAHRVALLISILTLIASVYPAGRARGDLKKSDYLSPANIVIVSGDHQLGSTGSALPEPFVVEVLDLGGRSVPGAKVDFTVIAGGGTLTPNVNIDSTGEHSISVSTNFNGEASATLIVGKTKVDNIVEVRVGNVDPVTFTVTVANSPPSFEPIGDKQVNEAATLNFTVSAADSDSEDTVTLSASTLPANASFDPSTGVFTFTPDYNQSGAHSVTFSATDGFSTTSETVTITVINVNRPPVLNPIGNQTVDEGNEIATTILATDPDGDALSFSASGMPDGAVLEQQQNAPQCTFRWTPGLDAVMSGETLDFLVTFTVTDTNGGTDSQQVTFTVRNVGSPPAPDIRVSPSSIDFGTVKIGEWADRVLQIQNDGDALLEVFSITSSDPQFTALSYSNVNPGASLSVTVRFTPSSVGSKIGELIITSNDPDKPVVSIAVQGEAIQTPDIRVSPSSIDFGEVVVGQSSDNTLHIHNDGDTGLQIHDIISNDSQFTVSGYSDVDPLSEIAVVVKFTPSSPGAKTAKLTVVSDDPDEPTVSVSLQGEGIQNPTPDIRVSPSSIDFGNVEVGQSRDKEFQIYNDGDATLQISSITSSNNQFVVLTDPDVAPGDVVSIPVRFAPSSVGSKTATITIASNDPDESSKLVSVQGKGIETPVSDIRVSPSSIDFGNVEVGGSSDKEFRIYNDGDATLQISSITSSNSRFVILDDPDVAAGGVVDIPVRFTPLSLGTQNGTITIASNDPDESSKFVSVQGKGVQTAVPDIRVSPSSIDFGNVQVGGSSEKEFRIYNDGNATLQISSITSSNSRFVILDDPDVAAGGAVDIPVRFTPLSLGTQTGTITIASNDPDESSKLVSVQGKGVQTAVPDIRVSTSSMDFGDVGVGGSLDKEFRIYNDGGATLQISSITSSNSRFVILDDPDVAPGGAVDIPVRFTPLSLGTETGTISIISNDPDEPTVWIAVEGEGVQVAGPDIYVSPDVIDFGEVELDESSDRLLYIYNLGDALLRIFDMTSSNDQFQILDDSYVSPDDRIEVLVRFTPSSLGSKSGVITITSNDPDEPTVSVWVYGEGIYPEVPTTGGWQLTRQQNLLTDLSDVHFVNEDDGWVVGSSGTVAHSSDGGDTWALQSSGTSRSLKGVYFTDSDRGWAVGRYGTILRTSNGGYSWSSQSISVLLDLNAVDFVSHSRGWIVGEAGMVVTTSNGYTWTYQDSGTQFNLNDLCFVSSYRGWAVGNYGTILRTDDGGQTWTSQYSGTNNALYGVDFVDYYEGWAVGSYGTILHTQNGGQTWVSQDSGITYNALVDVDFVGATHASSLQGWIVGHGGVILYTDDGGSTWARVDSGTDEALRSVQFRDANKGWTVGSYGTILNYSTEYPPVITSVSVSGSPASVGDVIRVTATGQARNEARFSISGVITNVGMIENPFGTYTGSYTVEEGVNVTGALVIVALTNEYGDIVTDTSQAVTIDTVATINWANVTPKIAGAGDTVTVAMGGEPDGTARFSIGTIVTDRTMTEASDMPGSYTGHYTVPKGTDANNVEVTVKLTDKLGNVTPKDAGQITIDTTAQITSVSVTGSPAKFGEPIIVVLIGEAGGSANFSISDLLSGEAMSETQPGVYTGSYTAPKGTHVEDGTVTVQLTDALGNTAAKDAGRVTIDTESRIESVSVSVGSRHDLPLQARAGETISVTMVGEPNGTARFSIASIVDSVPMQRTGYQSGTYTGAYTVADDDISVTDAVLTVALTDALGNVGTDASQRVTIDTTMPEITSVSASVGARHGVPIQARAGETISVSTVGEPGVSADFSIAGVIESVSMEEDADQPGTYAGTYTVADDTNVTDAVLTVTLTDGVGNVSMDASQRVTIDTTMPEITSVSVSVGARHDVPVQAKAGETIDVTITGEPGASSQFSIDGVIESIPMEEVTDQPGTYAGTYTVADDANVTDAVLAVTLTDAVGNVSTDASQRVTIDTTMPEITSVSVLGSPAKPGETVSIVMIGEPCASAQFSIADVVDNVPMEEDQDQPGTYIGTYTIADDMAVTDAVLTVALKDTVGNVRSHASKKVTIRPSWDVNRDGIADVSDLVVVGTHFGEAVPKGNDADVNGDGYVNILDLALVCKHFGGSTANASPGRTTYRVASTVQPEQLPILRKLYSILDAQCSIEPSKSLKPSNSLNDFNDFNDFSDSIQHPDLIAAKELLAELIGLTAVKITESRLMQNYPNPCNPETWIPYDLAEPGHVTVSIYSLSGQLVRTLVLGYKEAGSYSDRDKAAYWDGANEAGEKVSSGIYFYAIRSGDFSAVRKMTISR